MCQPHTAHDLLSAEMARRVSAFAAVAPRKPATVVEPRELAFERQHARRRSAVRRRVLILSLLSVAGMAIVAAIMLAAVGRSVTDADWLVFWAGWTLAALAAGGSACTVAWNWSLLPRQTAVVGLIPWAIVSAAATVVVIGLL